MNFFKLDSQSMNSDPDDELINSDAHSTNDFQKDVDFGRLSNLFMMKRNFHVHEQVLTGNYPRESNAEKPN